MKAVLISIRPKWCQKIISGEKPIEVRKTRPKLNTPFKCYIYCTEGRPDLNIPISQERLMRDYLEMGSMKSLNCQRRLCRKWRARRMVENRVCFTVRGEFGAQMSFESKNTIPYEDLCKCVNKDTLVELMCLDSLGYTGEDIEFITPAEYDERFGGDEDG